MKESTLATKIMMGILCVGVLLYLALYFILGFRGEVATTVAYDYAVNVGTEATAIIVREETVLTSSGSYVDLILGEGEKASAGSSVALIYDHASALDTRSEIRSLEAEVAQLRYALSTGTQNADASRLDEQITDAIVSLRSLAAGGDLTALEDSALHLRTSVFQRDFAFGDTVAAEQISLLIEEKEARLAALQRSLSQGTQSVRAPASGVFSGETDGYESLITPAMLDTISVSDLSRLLDRDVPPPKGTVGKIITDSTWYLAALFDHDATLSFTEGKTYIVAFSHDYFGNVEMKLERLESADGKLMAIFSSRTKLAETTLLRVQTVDIVVQEITGIRIPRKALRVETQTVAQEDGSTSAVNTYGVYTVVASQAEWKDVNVLHTGDTYYLVEPVNSSATNRLRAGDIVILSSSGLYDGKVVR